MQIVLENGSIRATIDTLGAELVGLRNVVKNEEVIWQGFQGWRSSAPVLFPLVGRLKNRWYSHEGKKYRLPLHGFARSNQFSVVKESFNEVVLELLHSENTLACYPFKFRLLVGYLLSGGTLKVSFEVENLDNKEMFFALGWHPGFNVPSVGEGRCTDISGELNISRGVDAKRFIVNSKTGLIDGIGSDVKLNTLHLSKELFESNTLVYEVLNSGAANIPTPSSNVQLWFYSRYLAIWTHPSRGGFVCVEPWDGLPDFTDCKRELSEKQGWNRLPKGQKFSQTAAISISTVNDNC